MYFYLVFGLALVCGFWVQEWIHVSCSPLFLAHAPLIFCPPCHFCITQQRSRTTCVFAVMARKPFPMDPMVRAVFYAFVSTISKRRPTCCFCHSSVNSWLCENKNAEQFLWYSSLLGKTSMLGPAKLPSVPAYMNKKENLLMYSYLQHKTLVLVPVVCDGWCMWLWRLLHQWIDFLWRPQWTVWEAVPWAQYPWNIEHLAVADFETPPVRLVHPLPLPPFSHSPSDLRNNFCPDVINIYPNSEFGRNFKILFGLVCAFPEIGIGQCDIHCGELCVIFHWWFCLEVFSSGNVDITLVYYVIYLCWLCILHKLYVFVMSVFSLIFTIYISLHT
jgi:hypothetical protein